MMKKGIILFVTVIVFMFNLIACDSTSDAITDINNAVTHILKGNVKGEIGKTYSTQWFDFTIKSIKKVDSYAGYTPMEGNELINVVITEKATYDDDNFMGIHDFYMDAEVFEDYVYPLESMDDTMMPTEFILKKDESVEYHMVYEIPADSKGLMLYYTEVDETEAEGALFTIAID